MRALINQEALAEYLAWVALETKLTWEHHLNLDEEVEIIKPPVLEKYKKLVHVKQVQQIFYDEPTVFLALIPANCLIILGD
jgi:hypothetical protein